MSREASTRARTELEEFNCRQVRHFERPAHNPRMVPRRSAYVDRQLDRLVETLQVDRGTRILEVGCGMGRFTLPMRARGLDVAGLELSPALLEGLEEHRRRWELEEAPLYCADMSEPPPQLLERFDAVVGFFTLHHVHDLAACLRGVAACLRPGGRAAFIEPNPLNPLYYLQITFTPGMSWRADAGIVRMRRSLLKRAMSEGGLTPESHARFGLLPPFLAERDKLIRVDDVVERIPLLGPFLAFQILAGRKPADEGG